MLLIKPSQANYNAPVSSVEFYRRPLPRHCIAFSSPEGKALFRESLLTGHMEAYFALAAQLCTQAEPAYCGLATLVMVLNALEMDPGRVWKGPWRWYHETMLTCCVDSSVLTEGIVMDKFVEVARCLRSNIATVSLHIPSRFFSILIPFSISCQTGTGHFAAIGGYHPERELVFLFDTARFKYPSHWVPLSRLWEGMSHVDPATQQPRGYLILTRATAVQMRPEEIKCSSLTEDSPSCPFEMNQLTEDEVRIVMVCIFVI
ncbi:unnamed protein product [Echinostoma caproni]|uniref:glutathione gamma-glutamylcysteinyltransferase n=1 Tax=Echinostoma caproni TaxID=27848 RepID=A0A183ALX0_9TREM|nr:unnamed protein product [Echinostoma caproni]